MYCAVFSLKNWYDAKDMRGTGGNDVNFAMDVPKVRFARHRGTAKEGRDHLRRREREQCQRRHRPTGRTSRRAYMPGDNLQYATWGGQACNPYDTARVPRGTSNGSGVSVSANLATCSICEQGLGILQRAGIAKQHRESPDHKRHPDGRRHRR